MINEEFKNSLENDKSAHMRRNSNKLVSENQQWSRETENADPSARMGKKSVPDSMVMLDRPRTLTIQHRSKNTSKVESPYKK